VQKQAAGVRERLLAGMERYRKLCKQPAFPGENLGSLRAAVDAAAVRMGAGVAAVADPAVSRTEALAAH
jgi:hypothetical protein